MFVVGFLMFFFINCFCVHFFFFGGVFMGLCVLFCLWGGGSGLFYNNYYYFVYVVCLLPLVVVVVKVMAIVGQKCICPLRSPEAMRIQTIF